MYHATILLLLLGTQPEATSTAAAAETKAAAPAEPKAAAPAAKATDKPADKSDKPEAKKADQPPLHEHPTIVAMWNKNNELRKQAGLPPQTLNPKLCQAAQSHAWHMARTHRFGHFGVGNGTPWSRARECGFCGCVRENIAGDYGDVERAFHAWRCSKGHWASIVGNDTQCGFGYAVDAGGRKYWVGMYGTE